MSAETEVIVDPAAGEVRKASLSRERDFCLSRESNTLRFLERSPYTPHLKRASDIDHSVVTEYIAGQTFATVFSVDADWQAAAKEWVDTEPYLEQYVTAEQDLLERGYLYRDLSLDHLIFTGEKAVLINHEETLVAELGARAWGFNSLRGTWETMAPEEFRGRGELTAETATYRVAAVAHLAVSGQLPFPRFPTRTETHHWRKHHAPRIAQSIPRVARKVLRVGLDVRPERRYYDPAQFFDALKTAYEDE